jgi:hypothetical protein
MEGFSKYIIKHANEIPLFIPIFHPEEIRGVGMDSKTMGSLGEREPSGSHLPEVLLSDG